MFYPKLCARCMTCAILFLRPWHSPDPARRSRRHTRQQGPLNLFSLRRMCRCVCVSVRICRCACAGPARFVCPPPPSRQPALPASVASHHPSNLCALHGVASMLQAAAASDARCPRCGAMPPLSPCGFAFQLRSSDASVAPTRTKASRGACGKKGRGGALGAGAPTLMNAKSEAQFQSDMLGDASCISVMFSPFSIQRPSFLRVPFFAFTSSASSSTRFMYSSKPCNGRGAQRSMR